MNGLSWDLVRSFLQVTKSGSLSSAARDMGVSQPTLSRNIQALEKQTQLQLFKRTTQGLVLTEAGEKLVSAALEMDGAADLFQRQISGMSEELVGDVRISANEILGIYLLPPALAAFQRLHPGVQVEIEVSNKVVSLNKRDADIALRMYRPTQPDLVARKLAEIEVGLYASTGYLEQHGAPTSVDVLKEHSLIGFDQSTVLIEAMNKMGYAFGPHDFSFRTDHLPAQINLARSDAGIVGTHVGLAKHLPELVRVLEWLPIPSMELWIVCHGDTQHNSRIRELTKFLSLWFAEDIYKDIL